jgi:chemotaxis methyl-accepting protein methylase
VDEDNLARAKAGRYPPGSLKEMGREVRGRWFVPDGPAMLLDHDIRAMVRFAVHDLEEADLPGGFDLVLCRYLAFTYFTGARLARAAARLHRALAPGGALMIGRRETVPSGLRALFTPWPDAGPCLWKSHPAGPE